MRIIVSPEAASELRDAVNSYDAERPGLGVSFVRAVDLTLFRIATFPGSSPAIGGPFRRALVHRFPFSLVYRVKDADIELIGVIHTRSDPEQLLARIANN